MALIRNAGSQQQPRYARIVRAFYATPWAITEEALEEITALIELRASGGTVSPEVLAEFKALTAARSANSIAKSAGGVQVLPLLGVISHRANMLSEFSGGTSTERFCQAFRQAVADPGVKAIVVDCDSPGGMVYGVPELADEIASARGKKPVTAVANCLVASAAYWLCSQADELVVSPSSLVGSIGVLAKHVDDSELRSNIGIKTTLIRAGKYKAEDQGPLTDDALAHMQSLVDGMYDQFIKAVARGRGTSQSAVRDGFGQGRVVNAQQAVKLGMADRVATLDQVLAEMGVAKPLTTQRQQPLQPPTVVIPARGEAKPELAADVTPDDEQQCNCACDACQAENCLDCDNPDCDDPNCDHGTDAKAIAYSSLTAAAKQDTKRVGGKDCTKNCFAYRPDDNKANWKLPVESPDNDAAWEKAHVRNAVSRWDQTDMPNKAEKENARGRVRAAAKKHDITLDKDSLKGEVERPAVCDMCGAPATDCQVIEGPPVKAADGAHYRTYEPGPLRCEQHRTIIAVPKHAVEHEARRRQIDIAGA